VLFLRSRRAVLLLLALLGAGVVGRIWGAHGYRVGQQVPTILPWSMFLPLCCAYAIGVSAASPLPDGELLGRRCIRGYVRGYLVVATVLAVVAIAWAMSRTPPPISAPAALRDLAGMLGLSLVSIAVAGASSGWVLPGGLMFCAIILRMGDVDFLPVTWLVRDDSDTVSRIIAAGLFVAGGVATHWWPRHGQLT